MTNKCNNELMRQLTNQDWLDILENIMQVRRSLRLCTHDKLLLMFVYLFISQTNFVEYFLLRKLNDIRHILMYIISE